MKTRLIGALIVYMKVESPFEWWYNHPGCKNHKHVKNPVLSKETRTKIAMLDSMNHHEELPCGSKKVDYTTFTSYWIYGPVLKYRPVRRGCGNDD